MRGVHSAVDEIRRNVFTEVARLAYEGGDLKRVDMIPYTIVPGEVARHRHDVFLERAVVAARVVFPKEVKEELHEELEELTELGHHEEKDKQKEDGSHE